MPFGRVKSIGHFLNNFILFFLLKKSFPIPNVSIDQWIFSVFIVWFPCYLFSDYFYGYCYYLLILICFADFQLTLLVFFYRLLSGISNSDSFKFLYYFPFSCLVTLVRKSSTQYDITVIKTGSIILLLILKKFL